MDFKDNLRRFKDTTANYQCDGLIILGSRQEETAALLIGALRPQQVALILTLDTQQFKQEICKLLVDDIDYLDQSIQEFGPATNAYDTQEIYQLLRAIFDRWPSDGKYAVDVTGGTKPMTVGLAKAAYLLELPTIYVASDYNEETNRIIKDTQRFTIVSDPYTTLGDIQRQRAFSFYKSHDYSTAQVLFAELANRVDPPQGDLAWEKLASAYAAWDSFNLEKAEQDLSQIVKINDLPETLSEERPKLQEQIQVIQRVRSLLETRRPDGPYTTKNQGEKTYTEPVKRFIKQQIEKLVQDQVAPSLLAIFYANAMRRENQQRLDMAAFLLYRCLEFMSQHRLAQVGILAEFPIDRVKELRKVHTNLKIPKDKIALLQGYKLLCTLNDDFASRCNVVNIQQQTNIRNQSVLAHGFNFISDRDYRQFKATVDEVIQHWCDVENIQWHTYSTICTFLQIRT